MEESYEIIASASQDSRPAKKGIRKLEAKWTSAETEKSALEGDSWRNEDGTVRNKKQVEQFALLLRDNFKQNEFNKEWTRSFYQATTTNLPFVKVSRTDFAIGGTNNFKFA
ncbi:uncharacterized protein LOC118757217 [Rhagoletis pomonella]|uniref:uncharacterized protein LOC118757217 n=1 Tax=Rhagoletis pomonella TaxID=28610 RepID=UPI0017838204|nr:uncharacterized protein LOC118756840 isoform X1 [Rhagoletis pomonella]XP_036347840.1 uncharacterized protein LOC118757217 [Rhagoletis pomonella]